MLDINVKAIIGSAFDALENPIVKQLVDSAIASAGAAAPYLRLALTGGKEAVNILNAFSGGQIDEGLTKQRWDRMVDNGAVIDQATAVEAQKRQDRLDEEKQEA